jgi:hypothetical protein
MPDAQLIKSECVLCGGSVEYAEDAQNEIVDCPHCNRAIKLQSTAKPAWHLDPFNKRQRFLTILALVAFVLSVLFAPWEIHDTRSAYPAKGEKDVARIVYAPIFSGPNYSSDISGFKLLWPSIIFSWIALVSLYGFLLRCCRTPASFKGTLNVLFLLLMALLTIFFGSWGPWLLLH